MKSNLQISHAWKRWVLRRLGLSPEKVTRSGQRHAIQDKNKGIPSELISIHGAVLDPVSGYVFGVDGKLIMDSTSWSSEKALLRFPHQGKPRGKKILDRAVFLGNQLSYYHWLLEDLPASLRALRISKEKGRSSPLILLPEPAPKYVESTSKLLGLDSLKISKVTRIEVLELISKPPALQPQRWAVMELESFAREYAKETDTAQTKLYISRRNESLRRPRNERQVEELFSNFGFEVISLAGLPVQKQIDLFYNAAIVAGSHGAGLSNIAFSRSLQKLVELRLEYQPNCFESLAHQKNAKYLKLEEHDNHNWEIDLTELERKLIEEIET